MSDKTFKEKSGRRKPGKSSEEPREKRPNRGEPEKGRIEQADFAVVGVGASAGGLKAIEGFVSNLPLDIHFAVVIVQHLDPRHESTVPAILSRITELPVRAT